MTATVDFDLSTILCRYVIDQDGALRQLPLTDVLVGERCGVDGGTGTGGGGSAAASSPAPTGLEDVVGSVVEAVPDVPDEAARVGLPQIQEVGP
jgi:phospholipid/cholesterol/gamma-HCH transport system substrate-binding protein